MDCAGGDSWWPSACVALRTGSQPSLSGVAAGSPLPRSENMTNEERPSVWGVWLELFPASLPHAPGRTATGRVLRGGVPAGPQAVRCASPEFNPEPGEAGPKCPICTACAGVRCAWGSI